jgi:UDP-N-acetylmuramoyl-tripeptide--D-alanyl-D-alanine ligase
MGMSSPAHEIRRLCEITPPDIGVELIVAPVHLEHLGSIERIAEAKAELIDGMKPKGVAILNADDKLVAAMAARHHGPVLTFGIEAEADVRATNIEIGRFGHSRFRLQTPLGHADAKLALSGHHSISNALAAAAVATCFAFGTEQIARALGTVTSGQKRGQVLRFVEGFEVIDDSYNSNPRALISMSQSLAQGGSHAKRRLVVAGEMLELGPDAAQHHFETGRAIAEAGITELWGIRGLAAELIAGAIAGGLSATQVKFFDKSEDAAEALAGDVRPGDLILIKGSRGVRTDLIVTKLQEHYRVEMGD